MDNKLIWLLPAIGLVVALQPSYIHPDEHFQTLEMLMIKFYGISGTVPWEFEPTNNARSYFPLYAFYGPLFYLMRDILKVQNPLNILRIIRFYNFMLYLSVLYYALPKLVNENKLQNKGRVNEALVFILSSYITWCYQCHSFSNSLETILLLLVLSNYTDILSNKAGLLQLVSTGFLISVGTFTRISFPAFLLLPSIQVFLKVLYRKWIQMVVIAVSMTLSTSIIVYFDTFMYESDEIIIAPIKNVVYNLNVDNLAKHGLHPRYTHLLVNIPLILGPGLLMIRNTKNDFLNLPLLSIISSLFFLSALRHQELRFLLPVVPLFSTLLTRFRYRPYLFRIWLVFNAAMCIIMGIFHQGGVIPMISNINAEQDLTIDIWWKTYSPPTWLYNNDILTVSTTSIVNNIENLDLVQFNVKTNHVVDLKGCDFDLVLEAIQNFRINGVKSLRLIVPNSMTSNVAALNQTYLVTKENSVFPHLDLDHLDSGIQNIIGLSEYKVSL